MESGVSYGCSLLCSPRALLTITDSLTKVRERRGKNRHHFHNPPLAQLNLEFLSVDQLPLSADTLHLKRSKYKERERLEILLV